jgi:hypothetical protein
LKNHHLQTILELLFLHRVLYSRHSLKRRVCGRENNLGYRVFLIYSLSSSSPPRTCSSSFILSLVTLSPISSLAKGVFNDESGQRFSVKLNNEVVIKTLTSDFSLSVKNVEKTSELVREVIRVANVDRYKSYDADVASILANLRVGDLFVFLLPLTSSSSISSSSSSSLTSFLLSLEHSSI